MIDRSQVEELFDELQNIHPDAEVKVTSPEGTADRTGFLTLVADALVAAVIAFDIDRVAERVAERSIMKYQDLSNGWEVGQLEDGKVGIYHPNVYFDERQTDMHDLDGIPKMTKIVE